MDNTKRTPLCLSSPARFARWEEVSEQTLPSLVEFEPWFASLEAECIVKPINQAHALARSLHFKYLPCQHFSFHEAQYFEDLARDRSPDAARELWEEVNGLLVYVIRSSSGAVMQLFDGFVRAVCAGSPLVYFLCGRSLIEHSSALWCLAQNVEFHSSVLREQVWPCFEGQCAFPALGPEAYSVHRQLLKYAFSSLVYLYSGPSGPEEGATFIEWREYLKSRKKVVPPAVKAERIGACITQFSEGHRTYPHLNDLYETLCEYCHPNGEARATDSKLGFRKLLQGYSEYQVRPNKDLMGKRLIELAKASIFPSVEGTVDGLRMLDSYVAPMEHLLHPKPGEILFDRFLPSIDYYGRPIWIEGEPTMSGDPVQEVHANRLRAVARTFAGTDASLNETWTHVLDSWPTEYREEMLMCLEKAADIYEGLSRVFRYDGEQTRLFAEMIFAVCAFSSYEDLLEQEPSFGGLRGGRRAFDELRSLW